MAQNTRVEVKGYRELLRALKRTDAELHRNLREGLTGIAREVVQEAKGIAESKGLRESGDLIRGIRPFATVKGTGVRSGAMHGGYAYPQRLEYEGRQGGRYGPRASLNPAVDRKEPEINRGLDRVLDQLEKDFS